MALTKREAEIAAEEVSHYLPGFGHRYRDRNQRCCPAQTVFGLRCNSLSTRHTHLRLDIFSNEVVPAVGVKDNFEMIKLLHNDPKEVSRRLLEYAKGLPE